MMTYAALSPWLHGALMLWTAGLVLVAGYLCAGVMYRGHRRIYMINAAVLMVCVYLFIQYITGAHMLVHMGEEGAKAPFLLYFAKLPAWLVVFLLVILTGYEVLIAWQESTWQRHHLSNRSIKETADLLPIGLCYFWDNGVVKLVNPSMNELSKAFTGEIVRNGKAFSQIVEKRASLGGMTAIHIDGTDPVYALPDGRVVRFHTSRLEVHGNMINELVAIEITNEYDLWKTLRSDTQRLSAINRRMELLGKQIDEMIAEKEVLDAKVRIHDSMGRTILATKKYLESGDPKDREHLDEYWSRVLLLVHANVKTQASQGPKADLVEAGRVLGLEVQFEGHFPTDRDGKALEYLMSGARECMTNACRHAGASVLSISSQEENGVWIIEYTNNGKIPTEPIQEGGGLATLRARILGVGGKMEVEWEPRFLLRLIIVDHAEFTWE